MAFDKNAYNRMYYQRNKELWEKYRTGSGRGRTTGVRHRETTYTTAKPVAGYDPNYAQSRVGQGRPKSKSDGKAKTVTRKEAQAAQEWERDTRNILLSRGMANEAHRRNTYNTRFGTLGRYRQERRSYAKGGMMDRLNDKLAEKRRDRPNVHYGERYMPLPQAGRDALRKWYMDSEHPYRFSKPAGYKNKSALGKAAYNTKVAARKVKNKVKRAAKSYASNWKTGAQAIKSGIKSYGSAWKTGAKSIAGGAKSAAKSAAKKTKKFLSKLGW